MIDLSELSSIKKFVDKFEEDGGRLDILVQNAAMNTSPLPTAGSRRASHITVLLQFIPIIRHFQIAS
jgi:NAD(P)-dependent dehydrogenase (short-subunit alcohol dehydrogenase family)